MRERVRGERERKDILIKRGREREREGKRERAREGEREKQSEKVREGGRWCVCIFNATTSAYVNERDRVS